MSKLILSEITITENKEVHALIENGGKENIEAEISVDFNTGEIKLPKNITSNYTHNLIKTIHCALRPYLPPNPTTELYYQSSPEQVWEQAGLTICDITGAIL